ncbi:MAG: transcription initiation factor IIB family protein [Candidatus Hodarchaeota archaeon]
MVIKNKNDEKKYHDFCVDYIEDLGEDCCEKPDLFETTEGEFVCRNCGMCHGARMVAQERRAYTRDEIKSRKTSEPVWRHFGPRTVIGLNYANTSHQNLSARKRTLFNRLNKINNSLISSKERNFWEARPKLLNLVRKIGVPDYIMETAWKIYSEVAQQKLTMGRSIDSFICASLYIAIRVHNFPRLLDELLDHVSSTPRRVHQALGITLRNVLPKLGLKYRPISATALIYRFGSELEYPIELQKSAVELLEKAKSNGLVKTGKDPRGLAAAALYLVGKDNAHKKTQLTVSTVSRITEVTLRSRVKEIIEYTK